MFKKRIFLLGMCLMFALSAAACTSDNAREDGRDFTPQNDSQLMASSMRTTKSSDEYPHTKALMQEPGRYIFIDVDQQEQHPNGIPFKLPFPFLEGIDWGTQQPDLTAPQFPGGQTPQPGQQQPGFTQPPQAPDVTPPAQQQPGQPTPAQPTSDEGISTTETRVIELTNAERRKAGLPDLIADSHLTGVAREKSNDMQRNQYFSHTSPTYGSPFDMMRDMGVTYQAAGENIAMGQRTPEEVVQAWMNSEGHRQNILNGTYTHIGVGYNSNGHYWTQMFISK